MPQPSFNNPAAASRARLLIAGWGANAVLVAVLSGLILLSALINGHWFTGVVGAVCFYLFADRLLVWFVASKRGAGADDTPDDTVEPELAGVLAKLEAARVQMAAEIDLRMKTRLPAGIAVGVCLWGLTQFAHQTSGLVALAILSVMGAGAGWWWASAALSERYRQMYKSEVLPPMAAVLGTLSYRKADDLDLATLRGQRLFSSFNRTSAEDEIFGAYKDAPIRIFELKLENHDDDDTTTVFDGLLAQIILPRPLKGRTAVIANEGPFTRLSDLFGQNHEGVRLEDPEFERRYRVFGSDQITARALLTPAFMERFLSLGERTRFQRPVALAQDNLLTIALPKAGNENLFEPPSYNRPAASRAALAKLHDDIAAVLAVAEAVIDLDQSVRDRACAPASSTVTSTFPKRCPCPEPKGETP